MYQPKHGSPARSKRFQLERCAKELMPQLSISPFQAFEETVLDRIAESQEGESRNQISRADEAGTRSSPIFGLGKILGLAMPDENDDSEKARREERSAFVRTLRDNGGFAIVEIDDSIATETVQGMWECVDALFASNQMEGALPFRTQTLTRASISSVVDERSLKEIVTAEKNSSSQETPKGYRYLETSILRCDGSLAPKNLAETLGKVHYGHIVNSHRLFMHVARAFTMLTLSAGSGMSTRSAAAWLHSLIDDGSAHAHDDDLPSSCSVHRLCKYFAADSSGVTEKEQLRSHADWSFVTLVPVADVAGLEIWRSATRAWLRPEQMVMNCSKVAHGNADNARARKEHVHARYMVLMVGKWLEILTNGNVRAAIHRVVTTKRKARMSAPFFLRPRVQIPETIQKRFGKNSGTVLENVGGDAVGCMHEYLKMLYSP